MTTLAKAHAAVDRQRDIPIPDGGYEFGDLVLHIDTDHRMTWWQFVGPNVDEWNKSSRDVSYESQTPKLVYVNDDIGDAAYLSAVRLAEKYGVRLVVRSIS